MEWQEIEGGTITSVPGILAGAAECNIKGQGKPDLALIYSERPAAAAALFTTNRVKGAPVLYDQALLKRNRNALRGVVINSGIANVCTGRQGLEDAARMASLAEKELGLPGDSIFVMSTGVIGWRLPMERIEQGIRQAARGLSVEGGPLTAQAIMTTDTVPKEVAIRVRVGERSATIGGMAKGAGMIHPHMATMLTVLATDARVEPGLLESALRQAVDISFNCITVDGDTSTSDTVLLLANGSPGSIAIEDRRSPEYALFQEGLNCACQSLAKKVVRDGEGATKFVEIRVRGAPSRAEARQVAFAIARSALVKTAIYGEDPNWGRVMCAAGYSGVEIDPERLAVSFGELVLAKDGQGTGVSPEEARQRLLGKEITIGLDLGLGEAEATVWTCDFSHQYVSINAEYTT